MNASAAPGGLAKASLVSLWRHATDLSIDHFECSGVFVGNGLVLTVKHVLAAGGALWVRPLADATQAYPVRGVPIAHPELDAALLRIETMPAGARAAVCDPHATFDQVARRLTLNGFFEGRSEAAHAIQLLAFDPIERYHLIEGKQPKGHSGSGVAVDGRLWGLTIAHFTDANTHRGCVVTLGQLWPGWLEGYVPDGPAASAPVTEGQARQDVIARLRDLMADAFKAPLWASQKSIVFKDGLPLDLQRALVRDDADLGRRCVVGVSDLARALERAMAARDPDLPPSARRQLRAELFEAMGCAAKLCIDLDAAPRAASAAWVVDVPAESAEGATLVARPNPEKSWRPAVRDGLPSLHDPHAIGVPIEMGEGEDAQRELIRLAYASVSVTNEVPRDITPEIERRLRGLLHHEADEGRVRFVVLGPRDLGKFSPEVIAWTRRMGLCLIALKGNDGCLFLFDEPLLLAKLQAFVRHFEDNPEWKP